VRARSASTRSTRAWSFGSRRAASSCIAPAGRLPRARRGRERAHAEPLGSYFVDERFLLTSSAGPFGVAALGISAHSDVLRDWAQGGPIPLHGTDDPASIGRRDPSRVRLLNADMRRLFALVPAGTPVSIRD